MPKVSLVAAVAIALACAACGVDSPAAPVVVVPLAGVPAKIELSAVPGVGAKAGTAAITARVLDGGFAVVPSTTVTFSADAGTLSAVETPTDSQGIATTTLTAAAGNNVKVRAVVGRLDAQEVMVAIQAPPPAPPDPLPPQPPVFIPPIPPTTPQPPSYGVTVTASSATIVAGGSTTLTATVAGSNGATLPPTAWVWDCDTSVASTDFTSANTATCTYPTAGTFTASVKATGANATGTATTTVTVTALPVPSYTVTLAASPGTIAAGGSTTLTATVTRVNGAPPPTSWAWDCDTSTPSTDFTSVISATCTYPTSGIFIAKVTVSSGTGASLITQSATVDVNVTAAATPLLVAITPAHVGGGSLGTINVGDSVDFTATVSSTVPLPAFVNWEWDDDDNGTFETLPTSLATPTQTRRVSMTVAGTWKFLVRVTDPATGRTATATSQVTVH